MLGDSRKAQEVFNTTLREAAVRAAQGELPKEPFWLFRERAGVVWKQVRRTCNRNRSKSTSTTSLHRRRRRSNRSSLRNWQSGFPRPPILSGTALALFYLDEFDYLEDSRHC